MFKSLAIASALEQFDVVQLVDRSSWSFLYSLNNISFFILLAVGFSILFFPVNAPFMFNVLSAPVIFFKKLTFLSKKLFSENLTVCGGIFFYFLFSVFTFLLISNLIGMIPYAVTTTSFLAVTLFFSSMGFFASLFIGLRANSWSFFGLFIPSGTPNALKVLLVLIEVVSYFARLLSLAIRLFANMMAGHALLKILSGFGFDLIANLTLGGIGAVVALSIIWAVTVLELLIAFLQAYVYIVLTSIYVNEAVLLH